jgi:hypothetical protein
MTTRPTAGGSYVRHEDGTLSRVAETTPAETRSAEATALETPEAPARSKRRVKDA